MDEIVELLIYSFRSSAPPEVPCALFKLLHENRKLCGDVVAVAVIQAFSLPRDVSDLVEEVRRRYR